MWFFHKLTNMVVSLDLAPCRALVFSASHLASLSSRAAINERGPRQKVDFGQNCSVVLLKE